VAATGLAAAYGCQAAGGAADGATAPGSCQFTVSTNALSPAIGTVGVVEWSLADGPPTSAKIVYQLQNAASSLLNLGGEAPVDLGKANHRTLLLGLKQSRDYTFHIVAVREGKTCVSPDYSLPTTGTLANSRSIAVAVAQSAKREPGFIVTSSGIYPPSSAFIIDADGEIVWSFAGPESATRALMDYEGRNMWMIALNVLNEGGEMRYVSMDGTQKQDQVPGLAFAHHDFTVMPGGKVAALSWASPGNDPPSEVLIHAPDGTTTSAFTIGDDIFGAGPTYHANALHYIESDDSFTIADRNENAVVKVSATGVPAWQVGGSCDGAPTGNGCLLPDQQLKHGHHLLDDGTLLVFNNGDTNHVLEFKLSGTAGAFSATVVEDYTGDGSSDTLGDVQRLPGGNTLVTYSNNGQIVELDASWNEVQTFTVRVGYSSWRPTLYGPPARL
jgi:hypothetical protein